MDNMMLGESGYERRENDAYFTPDWCTRVLLRHACFPNHLLWEPAAGDGAIVRNLVEAGFGVVATDINPAAKNIEKIDFFSYKEAPIGVTAIVTNPPYKIAEPFIMRSLDLMKKRRGVVAMLLRQEYDCASTRQFMFGQSLNFDMKIVLTKRPRWVKDSSGSPRHNYAWYIWDFSFSKSSSPVIRYDQ
tara:strand:+ start:368 stop:931 length:564 start_codon:yes stop_codon:yes gene_type:complete